MFVLHLPCMTAKAVYSILIKVLMYTDTKSCPTVTSRDVLHFMHLSMMPLLALNNIKNEQTVTEGQ